MKLVDAKKVRQMILDYGREAIDNRKMNLDAVDDIIAIERLIYEMEGEDAEPVARGEWVQVLDSWGEPDGIECSVCGEEYAEPDWVMNDDDFRKWKEMLRYCSSCGARMYGVTREPDWK